MARTKKEKQVTRRFTKTSFTVTFYNRESCQEEVVEQKSYYPFEEAVNKLKEKMTSEGHLVFLEAQLESEEPVILSIPISIFMEKGTEKPFVTSDSTDDGLENVETD